VIRRVKKARMPAFGLSYIQLYYEKPDLLEADGNFVKYQLTTFYPL
jgi:hypothetical protein